MNKLQDRLKFAVEISNRMAEYQRGALEKGFSLERKSDDSPVTEIDKNSERMFRDAVQAQFPDDAILGEEQGGEESEPCRWVVDPIDGTRKFMRGLPFWGICVAYEVENEPVLGVVSAPGLRLQWSALKGQGAFMGQKKIRVDDSPKTLGRCTITVAGRRYFEELGQERFYDLMGRTTDHDPGFLDACSYGLVSDGRLHGLLSCGDKWWDIAAPIAVIREAGGRFTDIHGGRPKPGSINIAAAPGVADMIMELYQSL